MEFIIEACYGSQLNTAITINGAGQRNGDQTQVILGAWSGFVAVISTAPLIHSFSLSSILSRSHPFFLALIYSFSLSSILSPSHPFFSVLIDGRTRSYLLSTRNLSNWHRRVETGKHRVFGRVVLALRSGFPKCQFSPQAFLDAWLVPPSSLIEPMREKTMEFWPSREVSFIMAIDGMSRGKCCPLRPKRDLERRQRIQTKSSRIVLAFEGESRIFPYSSLSKILRLFPAPFPDTSYSESCLLTSCYNTTYLVRWRTNCMSTAI
jgi:hypothetical protein